MILLETDTKNPAQHKEIDRHDFPFPAWFSVLDDCSLSVRDRNVTWTSWNKGSPIRAPITGIAIPNRHMQEVDLSRVDLIRRLRLSRTMEP